MDNKARIRLHTTVYAQCFSPCGKFLTTGDNFGNIAVFSLVDALGPGATAENCKPVFSYKGHDGPIYTLTSTDLFLISGGTGDITAVKWTDLLSKSPKVAWTLSIPVESRFEDPETNCLVVDKQESGSRLFAGCGNNQVQVWDLESGTLSTQLKGHTDYIHCIALRNNGQECVSASEDGTARIWDTRASGEAVNIISPYKEETCARPSHGKWLSCVAVDPGEDFLVCGGGPNLSMWHIRSLTSTSVYKTPGACQNHVMFYQDTVISAGTQPFVNHWHINGDNKLCIPCSPTSVFNVSINDKAENTKVLTVAGSGTKVDLCTNFGYRAFCLFVS